MLINKKTTFIKYLNPTNIEIFSIPQIKRVQLINPAGSQFIIWNRSSVNLGVEPPFSYLESGNSYVIISDLSPGQSYELDAGDPSSLSSIEITKIRQIDIYKGTDYEISARNQINKVTRVNTATGAIQVWRRSVWVNGVSQAFEYLIDNNVYFIESSSVPYTLWPIEPVDPTAYSIITEDGYAITTEDGYLLIT